MSDKSINFGINPRHQATFTFANRLKRAFWGAAYLLFFKYSPRPMHQWRAFILQLFGAKLGKHCHVYPKVEIWAPWNLVMEDEASIANGVTCYSMGMIKLGKRAVVSQGSHLCSGTHDYTDPNFQLYAEPIEIGADAWVCTDSFVGPGVTIGEGAVIGACSVVVKDMPEWTVCVGNPCKPLKKREMKR